MPFYDKFLNIGFCEECNATEKKRIWLLNVLILISVFFNLLLGISTYLIEETHSVSYVHLGMIFTNLIIIYLHQLKQYTAARVCFWVSNYLFFILFSYVVTSSYANVNNEYYFALMAVLAPLFFDKKWINIGGLVLSILGFYGVDFYMLSIGKEVTHNGNSAFVLFTILFLIVRYFKLTNEKNEKQLEKQHEQALKTQLILDRQKKELEALNKFQNHFFVNVTHEFRTPLTLIKGQINGLLRENTDAVLVDGIKKVDDHVNKIETLVNDIIDIAKIESHTLTMDKSPVAANQLSQKAYLAFEPMFFEKEIAFSILLCKEECNIDIDMRYMEKVIGNVLINSLKYTPENGAVVLSTAIRNDEFIISISDTGIGVKADELALIFERFHQSDNHINKAGGSGIGLAFCKEVVKLHNGRIVAKPSSNGGLTIEISLPYSILTTSENQIAKTEVPKTFDMGMLLGKNVLVVDDNQEMREYLKSIFVNYEVNEAENGQEALDFIENNNVDAVVADYMMPVMDGQALVENIKKKGWNIPIIVLTARADVKSKLTMLQLGVDDYLTKPFIEEELLFRLRNAIINDDERKAFVGNEPVEDQSEQSTDYQIVLKTKQIILENIANSYFGVAQLSDILEMSERTLYRILKKETGLSPNMFIREIKLCHVRNMIEENRKLSLQELALSVGLTNGTYLNQLYKERFGRSIHI